MFGLSSDLIDKAKELARQNFREGLNCAESVLKAVLDVGVSDLPPEVVAMATGFGGGIGLSGNNCGALIGAVMAVGMVHGRKNPLEGDFQARVNRLYGNPGLYRFFNGIPHEFRDKNGAVNCRELTMGFDSWKDKKRREKCSRIVEEAAAMAVDYIIKGKEEGYGQPFGPNVAGES